ncbi:DUF6473 family protein [Albirhodobacter sp. R86504]|uniref:DUF6473 family protein n=1 Tax=Albirhodobacter sp. R86504 TaxID=3093848 RepID=UPI003671D24C
MAFEHQGAGALDYYPCRYGKSKLLFRGPQCALDRPYIAAIGGTETYGKFVQDPWPYLIEQALEMPVANLGYLNAGVDVFLNDAEVGKMTRKAHVTIVQVLGAHNISNRFYAVHPRRNDRFLRASQLMQTVFNEIDFAEFNFTRHMLKTLQRRAPDRFEELVVELRKAWVSRMRLLLASSKGAVILLDIRDHRPLPLDSGLGCEPLLVTSRMLDEIKAGADALVTVRPSSTSRAVGTAGMRFGPLEELAATEMPGPMVHREIADALLPVVKRLMAQRG